LPYRETGLSAYYDALGGGANKKALSESYLPSTSSSQAGARRITVTGGISKERFGKYAELIGVQTGLLIEKKYVFGHPLEHELCKDYSKRKTTTGTNVDWEIPALEKLLKTRSEDLSLLIWRTLCSYDNAILEAQYSPNRQYEPVKRPSSLVLVLQKCPWIPQIDGEFVVPSRASSKLLPKEFPFRESYEWLHAVGFGEEERKKSDGYKKKLSAAQELGIPDESLADVLWFAKLSAEDRRHYKDKVEHKAQFQLPENIPSNPVQRAARVGAQAVDAPERRAEIRSRSVSVNREAVKQKAKPYLRDQYTNPDGEMICQVCKITLPFKLDDGSYYFETVEFLSVKNNSNGLKNHHYQNYLALCPNHCAMFQHVNGASELMKEMFAELEGNLLEVLLAHENATIYFTKTHIADLKKIIQVDTCMEEHVGDDQEEDESLVLRNC
jgi:hypothetical protein